MRHRRSHHLLLCTIAFAALVLTLRLAAPTMAAEHLCSDYTYQEDAQARIADYPANLDPDGDGVACEELPSQMAAPQQPAGDTGATAPTTVPATGVGTTAQSGNGVIMLLLAGGAAFLAFAGFRQRQRA